MILMTACKHILFAKGALISKAIQMTPAAHDIHNGCMQTPYLQISHQPITS